MLNVTCVHCQKGFQIEDRQRGTVVTCPHCQGQVTAGAPGQAGPAGWGDVPPPQPAVSKSGSSTLLIVGLVVGGFCLLAVPIIALLIAILLPALGAARNSARMMQNASQIRGVHQSMMMYAQGNRDWYPGLKADGTVWAGDDPERPYEADVDGIHPAARLEVMLQADYFEGQYLTSPAEPMVGWQGGPLDPSEYSYALLRLQQNPDHTLRDWPRHKEWKNTANSQAVAISDRNVTGDTDSDGDPAYVQSIWTTAQGDWRGGVGWNDGHVSQETSSLMWNTQYGNGAALEEDNLFQANDASSVSGGSASATQNADADLNHEEE